MRHTKAPPEGFEYLLQKIRSIGSDIPADEEKALADLPMQVVSLAPRHPIMDEGEKPSNVFLVLSEFLLRYNYLQDCTRQIIGFHLPGDIANLQAFVSTPRRLCGGRQRP